MSNTVLILVLPSSSHVPQELSPPNPDASKEVGAQKEVVSATERLDRDFGKGS